MEMHDEVKKSISNPEESTDTGPVDTDKNDEDGIDSGCTDSNAVNYDLDAMIDDGSCILVNTNDDLDVIVGDGGDDEICTGICDEETTESSQSDESDPILTLTIVMGFIFAVAIAIIFISRGEESMLTNEVVDQNEFIPDLPPLEPPKD